MSDEQIEGWKIMLDRNVRFSFFLHGMSHFLSLSLSLYLLVLLQGRRRLLGSHGRCNLLTYRVLLGLGLYRFLRYVSLSLSSLSITPPLWILLFPFFLVSLPTISHVNSLR